MYRYGIWIRQCFFLLVNMKINKTFEMHKFFCKLNAIQLFQSLSVISLIIQQYIYLSFSGLNYFNSFHFNVYVKKFRIFAQINAINFNSNLYFRLANCCPFVIRFLSDHLMEVDQVDLKT